ncbi:MAG: substrate-binding domain-containing protein [Rhodospirillales bacterium]|nr:substrate-binding domain-containing protein [Rhodospirillales bacterium]
MRRLSVPVVAPVWAPVWALVWALVWAGAPVQAPAHAQDRFITLASTTSTDNSGLFAEILPRFQAQSGIAVRVVAVGTGQAIRLAERGDADVLLVHHKPSEEKFVADGFGLERHDVMYNDFVVVGPAADPAGIKGMVRAREAFAKIARGRHLFVSRGDNSGTHRAEQSIWRASGSDPAAGRGKWFREAGAGMGAALNTASGMNAYILTDRGTWTSFSNKGSFAVLVEGDPALFNQYGVIVVSPERHPHVKADAANLFVAWLTGAAGQAAIAAFRKRGRQLFTPNAKPSTGN